MGCRDLAARSLPPASPCICISGKQTSGVELGVEPGHSNKGCRCHSWCLFCFPKCPRPHILEHLLETLLRGYRSNVVSTVVFHIFKFHHILLYVIYNQHEVFFFSFSLLIVLRAPTRLLHGPVFFNRLVSCRIWNFSSIHLAVWKGILELRRLSLLF